MPNFFELFDPYNQDIKPEKVATYEIAYEQEVCRNLDASIAGFYNELFRRGMPSSPISTNGAPVINAKIPPYEAAPASV